MKIILAKDIVGLGKRGDIREVKEGYFRNFLLPKQLAVLATREKIKEREKETALKEKAKKISEGKAAQEIARLTGQAFVFEEKVNEKGSLYKAIGAKDITKKLAETGFAGIEADWIQIEKPFKEVGKSEIEVKNPSDKSAKIFIEIREQH